MSRIWQREEIDTLATPIAGWGRFGEFGEHGIFRAAYGGGEDAPMFRHNAAEPVAEDAPQVDPVEQLRTQAFEQGYEAGVEAALAAQGQVNDAQIRLANALEQLNPVAEGTLSTMLSTAVLRLVGQIAGEVPVDRALLMQRCAAVAACVDGEETQPILRLHPDDMSLIDGSALGVQLMADPTLAAGCVRLDTADGWVEDGPDIRLARLKTLLDDMEGKP